MSIPIISKGRENVLLTWIVIILLSLWVAPLPPVPINNRSSISPWISFSSFLDQFLILSEGLSQIKGIEINLKAVETNLILLKVNHPSLNNEELLNQMYLNGIKAIPSKNNIRLALHRDIKYDDIDYVINTVSSIFSSLDK